MKELINKIGTFCINRLAELVGILVIFVSIFIFISLVTYSAEDPNFIFPENTEIENLLGAKGSYASDILFQSVGLISLLVPISFFFISLSIIIDKKIFINNRKFIFYNSLYFISFIVFFCIL